MEEEKEKKETKAPQVYNLQDVAQFENTEGLSSFGRMVSSLKPSAANFKFGSSSRDQQEKVFQSKNMMKAQFLGNPMPRAHPFLGERISSFVWSFSFDFCWGFSFLVTCALRFARFLTLFRQDIPWPELRAK
jgi:hypothetical protein